MRSFITSALAISSVLVGASLSQAAGGWEGPSAKAQIARMIQDTCSAVMTGKPDSVAKCNHAGVKWLQTNAEGLNSVPADSDFEISRYILAAIGEVCTKTFPKSSGDSAGKISLECLAGKVTYYLNEGDTSESMLHSCNVCMNQGSPTACQDIPGNNGAGEMAECLEKLRASKEKEMETQSLATKASSQLHERRATPAQRKNGEVQESKTGANVGTPSSADSAP